MTKTIFHTRSDNYLRPGAGKLRVAQTKDKRPVRAKLQKQSMNANLQLLDVNWLGDFMSSELARTHPAPLG